MSKEEEKKEMAVDNESKQENVSEAKQRQKKKEKKAIIGFILIVIGAVFGIVAICTSIFWLIIPGIPFAVAGVILIFLWLLHSRSHCAQCGESMYGCEFSYELVNRQYKQEESTYVYSFQVEAVCPHCGALKNMQLSVKAKNDMEAKNNINNKMQTYFRTNRK